MFKRIKTIKNVGRFINCPNTQLGKIVLIYGPNCYCKSTLSDIFRSFNTRNPDFILKAKDGHYLIETKGIKGVEVEYKDKRAVQ
jgi:wobble nucleotide-excising tRNase